MVIRAVIQLLEVYFLLVKLSQALVVVMEQEVKDNIKAVEEDLVVVQIAITQADSVELPAQ
jgi:hypothetical protein